MVDFSTLCNCLKEQLAAAAYYPNEISSTSEQTSILQPKEKETTSPDPKHTLKFTQSTLPRTKIKIKLVLSINLSRGESTI